MKRKQIVAGNWKMNMNFDEGRDLFNRIISGLGPSENCVVVCPPFIHLNHLSTISKGIFNLFLGAQNCYFEEKGAFTGEVSSAMLRSVGVKYVILGHSERRAYFGETDELISKKVDAVLAADMHPIFCCGEDLPTRESGKQLDFVAAQVKASLFHLPEADFRNTVIAYEPIWAIGTGKTATPKQAQDMHADIRQLIAKKYNSETAEMTTILYGGSCNPSNAKELFAQKDIDGGLIGGASLKAEDFLAIVKSFPN